MGCGDAVAGKLGLTQRRCGVRTRSVASGFRRSWRRTASWRGS